MTTLPVYDSIAACVGATGIPRSILQSAKKAGCDAFKGSRVDLAKLLPFLFSKMRDASQLPDGFANWTDVLNSEKAKREKIRREKDEGTVLDLPTAQGEVAEAESYYFGELDRMERELPSALAGLTPIEICDKLKKFNADLRKASREKFQQVVKKL